jgi:hypothetical protein
MSFDRSDAADDAGTPTGRAAVAGTFLGILDR